MHWQNSGRQRGQLWAGWITSWMDGSTDLRITRIVRPFLLCRALDLPNLVSYDRFADDTCIAVITSQKHNG